MQVIFTSRLIEAEEALSIGLVTEILDDEVRQIKKEIVESRGLIIKTNNLVNALGADIKSIAKRQAGYERRLNWNSGVAIAVIGVLSFVGLKLYFDAQTAGLRADRAEAEEAAESLTRDLEDEVVLTVVDPCVGGAKCREDLGEVTGRELHVHYRAHHLRDRGP